MPVALREINGDNLDAVLAIRRCPGQDRFVASVAYSLEEAAEKPQEKPWCRAVYAGERPVGFVMLAWNIEPRPPETNGPWFLWRLLIDCEHQGQGYGREAVQQVIELVRREGATELLTSYVPGDGSPAGFYARLGFVPRGDLDPDGEVILRFPVDE